MSKIKNGTQKSAAKAISDAGSRHGAYFLFLKLSNVRCFGPEQKLCLSDREGRPAPWTIILGQNGMGKTTLLQALVGFEPLKPFDRPLMPGEPSTGFTRFFSDLMSPQSNTFVRADLAKLSAGIGVDNGPETGGWHEFEWHFELRHDAIRSNGIKRIGEPSKFDEIATPGDSPKVWCCAYGAGRRLGVASLVETANDAEDATATLFSDRADLFDPEEWLLRLDYASLSAKSDGAKKTMRNRFDQVRQILIEIMPDVRSIRLVPGQGTQAIPKVEFETPYGWVPLRGLGYGYQTLITWVVDLVNRMVERYSDKANPLTESAVVLVDEIDLHLHPKWQRLLMERLTTHFPNTQFIATSHSPLVAQDAAYANLVVLRREGDHVIIDNDIGKEIRGWRVDQILTSDLFGLETARPTRIEKLVKERMELLLKPKRTSKDKHRLEELEVEIGDLPVGDTPEEFRERQEIRKALDELLKKKEQSPQ